MKPDAHDSITRQVMLLHAGDDAALQRLLQEHLPWIEAHVRTKLGAAIRIDGDTQDVVQEALLDVLRDGPRFAVENVAGFRALLARIVENNLRDRARYQHRARRDRRRQRPLPSDSVLLLDAPLQSVTRPSAHAERNERGAWLRLALDLLSPDDREIIRLRDWDGCSFAEAGAAVGIGEEAARKRYVRALPKLARKLELLRSGGWEQTLQD
jgi:RNA polymerase sigma-70 factor, ECF subfamily